MFILTVLINDTAYSYGPFKTRLEAEKWAASNLAGHGQYTYLARLCTPASTINQ